MPGGLPNAITSKGTAPEIGTLFDKNFSTYGTDYTATGGTFTQSGNNLILSGGNGAFTNYTTYSGAFDSYNSSGYTCHEFWKAELTFTAIAPTALTYGLGVGIKSANTWGEWSVQAHFIMDNTADNGKIRLRSNATIIKTTSSALVYSSGDQIKITLERIKTGLYVTIQNLTTGTSFSDSYIPSINTGFGETNNNTGRFAIWNYGGTITVSHFKASTRARRNIKTLCLGDSITYGLNAITNLQRWAGILQYNSKNFIEVNAGSSDRTVEVVLRLNEILHINPTYCVVNIGGNDMPAGISQATREGNYNTIISALVGAGITPIVVYSCPRDGFDVTPWNSFLATLTSYKRVDVFTLLKATSTTNWNLTYKGDNYHPNPLGHSVFANEVIRIAPEVL